MMTPSVYSAARALGRALWCSTGRLLNLGGGMALLCLMFAAPSALYAIDYPLPGGSWSWGLSQVWRLEDNKVRLYSATWISGGDWLDWTGILDDVKGYRNGALIDGPHTVVQSMAYWPQVAQSWRIFTLSQQGVGSYRRTARHKAYHLFYGTYYFGDTDTSLLISRPTIYRDGPQPWFLGGSATSGTYTSSATFRSDPMGAYSTPHWYFASGSEFGTLSCSDCASPTYTVTRRSGGCQQYNVQLRASYGGLETDTFWIFNDSPYNLHQISTTPIGGIDGWQTNKKLKVRDMCGGGMNWVAVNETFQDAWFPFPEQTSLWEPFDWEWGVWTGADFDGTGQFVDIMFELRLPGKYPQPMNTGANGNSEAPQHTVSQANQYFFAGSQTNGAGVLVQHNVQLHYLDHGNHY